MMKVLWLLTARAGSKSIPNKNVKPLGGRPLLAYRISAALRAGAAAKDVWISTDSQDYADTAKSFGAEVPFLRPAALATDDAKSIDVVLHAMNHAQERGLAYDAIGLLEPTSPFVLPSTLNAAVERLAANSEAEGIVATRHVSPVSFFVQPESEYLDIFAERLAKAAIHRRQDTRPEITPSGGFYIFRWKAFLEKKTFYTVKTLSHLVSDLESLEIDESKDWDWAEFLLQTGRVKTSQFGL